MNAYLERLNRRYAEVRSSIEGYQSRAAEADRDLTEDELRSIKGLAEEGKTLAAQITDMSEVEQRSAAVSELASKLGAGAESGQQDRSRRIGGATTKDRDPGHYRSEQDGGQRSFFSDMYRARVGDEQAARRLAEHTRATLTTGDNGAGLVAPKWLTDEYDAMARQGRVVANAVRRIPLGTDPRPMTLPKQTGSTSVAAQPGGEGGAIVDTGAYDTDVDTITPSTTAGQQTVSRQMLDSSTPAVDLMIYGDLMGEYNDAVEAKVCTAILAAGPAAIAATEAGTDAGSVRFDKAALKAAIAVRKARKVAPSILVASVGRYGDFLALDGEDGRPLIPNPGTGQSVNVIGQGSVSVDGIVYGLGILATGGATDDGKFAVAVPQDVLLFESDVLRFRYEEVAGPASIKLGIWAYTATFVKKGGDGVQTVTVTADTGV